jgi:hypothetical protein
MLYPNHHTSLGWLKTTLVCACGAFVSSAFAANITVNTAADIKAKIEAAKSGDVITIQSGTYNMKGKEPVKLNASNVTVVGFGVTLDYQATATTDTHGVEINGDSNFVRGVTVVKAPDNGIFISGDSNTVERCTFKNCFDTGLQISAGSGGTAPKNNKIINCDSFNNFDTKTDGGNADGFAAKIGIGSGNSFSGCRAIGNSDDAWDFFVKPGNAQAPVTLSFCLAATSGNHSGNGNGFKVGSADSTSAHKLDHCIAFKCNSKGFDQNNNTGKVTIDHCTSSANGGNNFSFTGTSNGGTFTNNVSAGKWSVNGTQSGNLITVSTGAFASTDLNAVTRDGNGNLKFNNFMKFANSGGAGANP